MSSEEKANRAIQALFNVCIGAMATPKYNNVDVRKIIKVNLEIENYSEAEKATIREGLIKKFSENAEARVLIIRRALGVEEEPKIGNNQRENQEDERHSARSP